MRGDDFLTREGIQDVDFLKLDLEGAEHLVLQGLESSLRRQRVRFLQFEYGRVNILTHFLLRDFPQLLTSYGYVVGKIYPDYVDFSGLRSGRRRLHGSKLSGVPNRRPVIDRLAGALQLRSRK